MPWGQLVEKSQVDIGEMAEGGQFQNGLGFAFEQHRQHHDAERRALAQAGADLDVVRGDVGDQDAAFFQPALAHQTLPHTEFLRDLVVGAVGGQQLEGLRIIAGVSHVERSVLRAHQGRQFGEEQFGHGQQIALTLHHASELGDVGLEPVLVGILARGFGQVDDHLVDVVLEGRDFAQGFHRDGTGQVALGDGRGDVGDGADLGGEVGGKLVDVVRKVTPQSRGAGHQSLSAELALNADFAGHVRDLVGEDGQGIDHSVDGVGQLGDFALGFQHQFAFQIAVGDVGDDLGDTADLGG